LSRACRRASLEIHFEESLFLQSALWDDLTAPLVVVSHHAPSILSVPRIYIDDPAIPMFASRLERTIIKYQPRLWVHGHLHNHSDYMIQETRIVCNPYGYPGENELTGFDPAFVVDLGPVASNYVGAPAEADPRQH
jgi:Icc-related predicted phosphoesterase